MTPSEFRTLRRTHRVSIIELAQLTGIHPLAIVRYETGRQQLPLETVEMMVDGVMGFGELRRLFNQLEM